MFPEVPGKGDFMDVIKAFLKNPRRFIKHYSKNVKKVRKRKIAVIIKFLWFSKKKLDVKNLKDLQNIHLKKYVKRIEQDGIWDKNRKQHRKTTPKTIQEHKNILKDFIENVKITTG